MAVFGAEQIQESKQPSRYFDKYIVAVNIGGIFATLLVSYIQGFDGKSEGYFHGYLFAASSLVGAILLFILGQRFYIHIKPHDTIITKCIPVVINALQTWWRYKDDKDITMNMRTNSSSTNLVFDSMMDHEDRPTTMNDKSPSFLDYARAANHGKFIDRLVDDVKSLRRVIVVFLLLIPYWLIYYQVEITVI
jgi:peptide/histidine transporter 3/4